MAKMGRPTLFDKTGGRRVQANVSKETSELISDARIRVEDITRRVTGQIAAASDGDVLDYLVLGEDRLLRELKRKTKD